MKEIAPDARRNRREALPGMSLQRGNDLWLKMACESLAEIETLFAAFAERGTEMPCTTLLRRPLRRPPRPFWRRLEVQLRPAGTARNGTITDGPLHAAPYTEKR